MGFEPNEVRVVYDGACPLCRASDVRFSLIDARTDPAERRALELLGLDLNDGIALRVKVLLFTLHRKPL